MRFLVAFFVPPLAILSCRKILSFVFNLVAFAMAWAFLFLAVGLFGIPFGVIATLLLVPLGVVFWILSVIHAMLVVTEYADERRHRGSVVEMERARRIP